MTGERSDWMLICESSRRPPQVRGARGVRRSGALCCLEQIAMASVRRGGRMMRTWILEPQYRLQTRPVRPFVGRAKVSPCGCSRPLQRAIVDFAADQPFALVRAKLREHYGFEIGESTIRRITFGRDEAMFEARTRRGRTNARARRWRGERPSSRWRAPKRVAGSTSRRSASIVSSVYRPNHRSGILWRNKAIHLLIEKSQRSSQTRCIYA